MSQAAFQHSGELDSRFPPSMFGRLDEASQIRPRLDEDDLLETTDEFGTSFKVKVTRGPGCRERANSLMRRRYVWRGYATGPLNHERAGRITFSAYAGDVTLGTITAALDAQKGLFVERLYPEEVRKLRSQGRKLCEFTELAIDETFQTRSVLGSIFHVAALFVMDINRCTDVLVEVNPRHSRFYQRMLGFTQFAELRLDKQVEAPAVLLRLDLQHCVQEMARLGGRRSSVPGTRSFYPYLLAPLQAESALSRLRNHRSVARCSVA